MIKSSRRTIILELIAILWLGLLYSAFFLSTDHNSLALSGLEPDKRIQAIEHERLAGVLIPAQIGLGFDDRLPGIGHLPGWNPYLGTGTPLVNNAFFYLFNPFMSLPVLTLGAVQGTKIAIIIGFLVAGVNMWAFARAIGLGGVSRVTIGALYMMSGGIIGKYDSGHFQLGLSLAWPPLVFAGLWWTLHSRDRRAPVLMAVAFALLFFSGNIYYTLHTLLCCTVIVIAHAFSRVDGRWQLAWPKLRPVIIGGVLALGLVMIQFLPVWTVRDYVSHNRADFDKFGQLIGQYDMGLSIANFVTPWDPWTKFQDPPINMWGSVDYAYIGPAIFALIAGLVLLMLFTNRTQIQHQRPATIALLLAVVMMIWGAAQTELIQQLYRHIALLSEFRFLGRANSIAGLWWIVLAGIALDNMWKAARSILDIPSTFDSYDRARMLRVLVLVGSFWLWLLLYTFSTNLTRLSMSLNNVSLLNTLNNWSFESYLQAMQMLVNLFVLALIGDTMLLLVRKRFRVSPTLVSISLKKLILTRMIRIGLFMLALVAISDVMHVNYRIIRFGTPGDNFGSLYAIALSIDHHTEPFPSIKEPWSPSTFDSYYSRVRNWGLNEGWVPLPLENDIIPENAPRLLNLPGWAIASSQPEFGGASYRLSLGFVENHDGVLHTCTTGQTPLDPNAPCDLESENGAGLYQLPISLPYAFMVSEDVLNTRADTLTRETVRPTTSVTHHIDTIQLVATMPDTPGQRYYLIVQETHFPGWNAFIDNTKASTFTAGNHTPGGNSGGFIAIPMTQGTHTYTLRFEPPGFKLGILITTLTLIAIIAYLAGFRWPSRPAAIPVTTAPVAPAAACLNVAAAPGQIPAQTIQPVTKSNKASVITAGLATLILTSLLIYYSWLNQKKAAIADSPTEVDQN